MEFDYPSVDELQISLIGTGGGYGESLLIHLPNDVWIVIDSCNDPEKNEILPIRLLRDFNVDFDKIKLIIATHWHNDHINGLADILELSKNAIFSTARATDTEKFKVLLSLDHGKDKYTRSTSHYLKCIEIVKKRNFNLRESIADRILYKDEFSEVISLSPSDYANQLFNDELSVLFEKYGDADKKIESANPNSRSIVILIKTGEHRVILGADLEVESDERIGWHCIVKSDIIDKKATLFKIPHHGSKGAYDETIWDKLVEEGAVAGLTPWNLKDKLPDIEMLDVFCKKSNFVFMTSAIISDNVKKRQKTAENIFRQLRIDEKMREIKFAYGHIRYKIKKEEGSAWQIDTYGSAFHVNPVL